MNIANQNMFGKEYRVSVIGSGNVDIKNSYLLDEAEEVGRLLAKNGITIVCGGGSGIMQSVCKGAKEFGGHTIGILPTIDMSFSEEKSNSYIDTPIMTGIGYTRNSMMAANGNVTIAIGGAYGTLSEIAYGIFYKIKIIGLHTWHMTDFEGNEAPIIYCETPAEAVSKAVELIKGKAI